MEGAGISALQRRDRIDSFQDRHRLESMAASSEQLGEDRAEVKRRGYLAGWLAVYLLRSGWLAGWLMKEALVSHFSGCGEEIGHSSKTHAQIVPCPAFLRASHAGDSHEDEAGAVMSFLAPWIRTQFLVLKGRKQEAKRLRGFSDFFCLESILFPTASKEASLLWF